MSIHTIELDEKQDEKIDKARKLDLRSKRGFILAAAVERAEEIIKNKGDNYD